MDLCEKLLQLGFGRVIALDGHACGIEEPTLLLALWTYEMEQDPPATDAWIHPYYRISNKAYHAAKSFVSCCEEQGISAALRDDLRFKPIMARLPGFSQGRNTLSYVQGVGSRFYVKAFAVDQAVEGTVSLEEQPHGLHCGSCRRCMDACPNKAITDEGFHVERCIRYWMMPGKPVPEDVRALMGNRLIGCDECQRCCPHNPVPSAAAAPAVPLERLLVEPKEMAQELKDVIGVNLTLPNRLLAQSCMVAGCSLRQDLLPALEALAEHPSPVVQEHAAWAAEHIKSNGN